MNPTEAELIAAAHDLQPELSARRREIDELRQLPQDLADKMAAAGFYRLLVPEHLGGVGVSPAAMCEICETLAYANGSAAWCVFIGTTSQYLFGAVPDSLLEQLLEDPSVITSGVFADSGTCRAEERNGQPGFVINGHWRWGSGSHNAAWISGGVHEVDAEGETIKGSDLTRVFFRPEEIDIADNWHVSGLRGSGSSDFTADEVWVPSERLASLGKLSEHAELPVYRFPRFGILGIPIGAICLGMARASLDEVIAEAQQKTPQGSRRTLSMRPSLHRDVAQADTELAAARLLLYKTIEDAWAHAQTDDDTLEHRRAIRAANNLAVETSVRVIDKMYTVMGGTSVFETSVLQQHFRDVHVASQHMMVNESIMEVAGRMMLGLDDKAFGI